MTVTVRFEAKCSICEREFTTEHGMPYGGQTPNPYFEQLRYFDHLAVCPDHKVTLTITSKDQEPLVISR